MNKHQLKDLIKKKKSFLCIGLDPDGSRLPFFLKDSKYPLFDFCKEIIEKCAEYAVAFKINTAFFECHGADGWHQMEMVKDAIPNDILTIADAKRGDIGNTSRMYAKAFFEKMDFDAITVAPYMGEDSVSPFLEFPNKWVFLLAATSNPGSLDFQTLQVEGSPLYKTVINTSLEWSAKSKGQLGFVIGAQRYELLQDISRTNPDQVYLIPGVGAQGGSLERVMNSVGTKGTVLLNSSRAIIYAGENRDFAERAKEKCQGYLKLMANFIQ